MPPKNLPFYPILFGIFPALSLLSTNVGDARFLEVLLPLAIVVGVTLLLWGPCYALLRNHHKVALLVTAFWIPFHVYGSLADGLKSGLRDGAHSPIIPLALAALLGMGGLALFAWLWRCVEQSGGLFGVGAPADLWCREMATGRT